MHILRQIKKNLTISRLFSFEKNAQNIFMAIIIVSFALAFGAAFVYLMIHGHHSFALSRQHPWGFLIAIYVFFVSISTGLTIVASLGHVFGIKEFELVSNQALMGAIATLCAGFLAILLEVGHPITMLVYVVLTPNFHSAIWWMSMLYGLKLVILVIELLLVLNHNHKYTKVIGLIGLLVGIAAFSNLGAVFGFLVARPIANGVFFPIYFILSAFVSGAYVTYILYAYEYKLNFTGCTNVRKMLEKLASLLIVALSILLFFEVWRIVTSLYGGMPERASATINFIQSPNFIIGEVLLGSFVPFVTILYTKNKNPVAISIATFIGMIGVFTMRYDLVHYTQVFPMQIMKLEEYVNMPSFIGYFPSLTEIGIGLGSFALCFLLYYTVDKVFELNKHNPPTTPKLCD